jgi:glutaredoxin
MKLIFKAVRAILGPFLLLNEKLNQPQAIQRTPEAQAKVDKACQNLALYQFNACPFCIKVRQEMRRLSLPIALINAQQAQHKADLLNLGGSPKVPCLRLRRADGKFDYMYESKDIIAYLRKEFSAV